MANQALLCHMKQQSSLPEKESSYIPEARTNMPDILKDEGHCCGTQFIELSPKLVMKVWLASPSRASLQSVCSVEMHSSLLEEALHTMPYMGECHTFFQALIRLTVLGEVLEPNPGHWHTLID